MHFGLLHACPCVYIVFLRPRRFLTSLQGRGVGQVPGFSLHDPFSSRQNGQSSSVLGLRGLGVLGLCSWVPGCGLRLSKIDWRIARSSMRIASTIRRLTGWYSVFMQVSRCVQFGNACKDTPLVRRCPPISPPVRPVQPQIINYRYRRAIRLSEILPKGRKEG